MDFGPYCLYIENERLFNFAASSARLLKSGKAKGTENALKKLNKNMKLIKKARDAAELKEETEASCRLLDNFYMLSELYVNCRQSLLTKTRLRSSGDSLLIEALCRSLLDSGKGKITKERCGLYLSGFQSVTVLSLSELSLFKVFLKLEIFSSFASLCRELLKENTTADTDAQFETLFQSLRVLNQENFQKLLRQQNKCDEIFCSDPAGIYEHMDEKTRLSYLKKLQSLAAKEDKEEYILARELLNDAEQEKTHIGFYLFPEKSDAGSKLYIFAVFILSLGAALIPAFYFKSPPAALLLIIPISELIKNLLDFILRHIIKPSYMPRMDISGGIPEGGRSLCVISSILSEDNIDFLALRLSELWHCCKNKDGIYFSLLADLPEANEQFTPQDEKIIKRAEEEIAGLNLKYGEHFFLFTRKRRFNGESYTGRERKRGAIMELSALLLKKESSLKISGPSKELSDINYIVCLDSDTRVYPGSIEELISAMLHPLNKPVLDSEKRIVVSGHGLIQPRINTQLQSANATDFALIFAGAGGSEPYSGIASELYNDAFSRGGFGGKGIIDVKALDFCLADRLPENQVLSHDALEGAYLRGGFAGDVEFEDFFPSNPISYFKRLHRWLRGDVQNAPWIFSSELPAIERFRLFQSLLRCLLAPFTFAAICIGFFIPEKGLIFSAFGALLSLLTNLLLAFAERGLGRPSEFRLRRHTRLLNGIGGAIVQSFMELWLLPYKAWICLSAIFLSLWRMLLTRKNLLQWQTAAQSENQGKSFKDYLSSMFFAIISGLFLLFFSPAIIGKSVALMWLLSPLCAYALALPAQKSSSLNESHREFLLKAAADNYNYFKSFCTAYDNFLPPDNYQSQPPAGIAHRSSPTNIGLSMCSSIAAAEMKLISPKEAALNIGRTLYSIEKLPKYRGQLYNWYDTHSLEPLNPAFISTVDSGNLYACLICCREALKDWGEEGLSRLCQKLMDKMDFSFLFDPERELFYICYDSEKKKAPGGHYDLMASEAMLTSYIAIAKGDVPFSHWSALSRAQLQKDGYQGLASWSGTMFEYLMPEIFLPYCAGSLLSESSRFCLHVQRRRHFPGKPWGISESAYFSLDSLLNYRYKANGCGELSLKRGQDKDMVISPYSSFLALHQAPEAAVKNLILLKSCGAYGKYGFMEALDLSPSRCRRENGEKVQCYMAHHIGMSICSCANCLCDGIMQRYFMSAPECSAMELLIQERLPGDTAVIGKNQLYVLKEKQRNSMNLWSFSGNKNSPESYCLFSNGIYNMLLSSSGLSSADWGDIRIYGDRKPESDFSPQFKITIGEKLIFNSSCGFSHWDFYEDRAVFKENTGDLSLEYTAACSAEAPGELRRLDLKCEKETALSLSFSLMPILAPYKDYENHPAFWKLGIGAEEKDGMLLLRRLRRGNLKELWLCIGCSRPSKLSAERGEINPYLSEPSVNLSLNLSICSSGKARISFALGMGRSEEEAIFACRSILKGTETGKMSSAAASRLGMDSVEYGKTMDMLPCLLTPISASAPKEELWKYGVSGDFPIICCKAEQKEAGYILNRYCLLKSCGIECELVYLSSESGEYRKPAEKKISDALGMQGLESLLGARGGVHFVPIEAEELIKSRASYIEGFKRELKPDLKIPALSAPRVLNSVPEFRADKRSFRFNVRGNLPGKLWQFILCNKDFGAIVSDCGPGFMWFKNSRELRVNLPPESCRSVQGNEALFVDYKGERLSLFAANDGYSCNVGYTPGAACWDKDIKDRKIKLCAFVPPEENIRIFIIEGAAGLKLCWQLKPLLGPDEKALKCSFKDGIFKAQNEESYIKDVCFIASLNADASCRCDFLPQAMEMSFTGKSTTILACGICEDEKLKDILNPDTALSELKKCRRFWEKKLSRFSIKTNFKALDNYINFFSPYQILACRLMARASLYQSGGAFGFRDQLQDGINLLFIDKAPARERILDCCRHQYEEGDVMHWWHSHPYGDKGIRSRCSDDLLWLCWAVSEYCEKTGDYDILSEMLPYLSSAELSVEEKERYEIPRISDKCHSVLDHVRTALHCCEERGLGPHGLPFIGSGDWNDGLNEVNGESVWLGWFYSICALKFSELLKILGEPDADHYYKLACKLGKSADNSFNGSFYKRGYHSDGEALGGEQRLDSICQSFGAFCPFSDKDKVKTALKSSLSALLDKEHKIVKLFSPPYSPDERSVGYISSYGEGFRENGGQYTHAAVWLASACIKVGMVQEGQEILLMLLPENHNLSLYEAEPYVLAADVYSAKGHKGEAGWSWYTGSAGWYYRVIIEDLLGLELKGGCLLNSRSKNSGFEFEADFLNYQGQRQKFSFPPPAQEI